MQRSIFKHTPFLDFYKKYYGKRLDCTGLCNSIGYDEQEVLDDLRPTNDDRVTLLKEGYCITFWASGLPSDHEDELYVFTPLRQTIVLFCAAINNEL